MDILKIKQFLSGYDYSYNYDYDYGYGDGYNYGNCDGDGYCDDGNGSGYGNGYGYGKGSGNGRGSCYGKGSGYGNGYGKGSGYGNGRGSCYGKGSGYGNGNGNGIKSINGYDIYRVDNTPTIFTHIHGSVAKGYILEQNVILKPCYIVKDNGYFAHGETLKEAQSALEEKILDNMDIEEKIKSFKEKFPDVNKKYPVKDFYKWHHNLTGSCDMGRKAFARSHNIDIDNDIMTVSEFMDLTENAYCGEVIKELKERYKNEKATIYEYARMCKTYHTNCPNCPMWNEVCTFCIMDNTQVDKANEIILKWCKEHPIKTR